MSILWIVLQKYVYAPRCGLFLAAWMSLVWLPVHSLFMKSSYSTVTTLCWSQSPNGSCIRFHFMNDMPKLGIVSSFVWTHNSPPVYCVQSMGMHVFYPFDLLIYLESSMAISCNRAQDRPFPSPPLSSMFETRDIRVETVKVESCIHHEWFALLCGSRILAQARPFRGLNRTGFRIGSGFE